MNEKNLDSKKENSILAMYENVKKVNNLKDLIIENNEQIFNEFSKYDSQISSIKNELNALQGNFAQTQTNTLNDIKVLEDKLRNNYSNINKATKEEVNKEIKKIITQIEETKKINENLVTTAMSNLNIDEIKNNISNVETINKENISKLENDLKKSINEIKETDIGNVVADIESTKNNLEQKIENIKELNEIFVTSNIEDIKANISCLEANSFSKIEELGQELRNIIEAEKQENQKELIDTISNLNIDEIKNNISNLETINKENISKLENDLKKSINEIKETDIGNVVAEIENTKNNLEQKIDTVKENTETFVMSNIEDIKTTISEIQNNTLNKIEILEQNSNAIEEKIEEFKYFDTIRNLENSLSELKETALNTEYNSKAISKKVEELDKVKKEQEKFIVSKISELDTSDEINNIKNDLEQITKKIQEIELLYKQVKVDSLSQMQDYIEKRIIKMKYVSTTQTLTKNIAELKRKVQLLENAQNSEDTIKENIELIISKRLKEQEIELMKNINNIIEEKVREKIQEILKKQKAKKSNQLAQAKKQQEYIESTSMKAKKTIQPSNQRTNYDTQKSKSKNSLDDMVAKLSNVHNVNTNKTKSSINALAKTVKKSQILNFDN